MGYSPWSHKESDRTEPAHPHPHTPTQAQKTKSLPVFCLLNLQVSHTATQQRKAFKGAGISRGDSGNWKSRTSSTPCKEGILEPAGRWVVTIVIAVF